VGRTPSFRNDTAIREGAMWFKRYQDTKFTSGFKSLLTLLELAGANLHDEKIRGMAPGSVG
jgi:hypothetical protein